MKRLILSLLLICLILHSHAQVSVYSDPNYTKPTTGYGADGTHSVGIDSFANPYFAGHNINVYYPSDTTGPVPTIFYSHAYGANNPLYNDGLFYWVASKGYALVYVPYQTTGVTVPNRYANLLNGFRMAARSYPNIIDTTRAGFMGWSFGGGATIGNAYACFTQNNWGSNGRFMYSQAPWYSYNISQSQLQSFPQDVKLLMQIFNDDSTNDHRMAIDIFQNINIPAAEKDFVLLQADTVNGYIYQAGHTVPTTREFNAFDYYGCFRLLDALCDYTFHGNAAGKNVALGHGSSAQITMPSGLKPLVENMAPLPLYPQAKYEFPCSDSVNLRAAYCTQMATGIEELNTSTMLRAYPNPVSAVVRLQFAAGTEVQKLTIFNTMGQQLYTSPLQHSSYIDIDMSAYPAGIYFAYMGGSSVTLIKE
jgi:dienelactone hydrolase